MIKNGIKFGIGFVIGQAVTVFTARVLTECLKEQIKRESNHTEQKDVEVE